VVWLLFKFLFSVGLVALAGLFIYQTVGSEFQASSIGAASVLLFFAAWPWVDHERPNRSLSLARIVLSLLFGVMALNTATGGYRFPRLCDTRRGLLCELENFLYALGGNTLAAAPYAAFAIFLFLISFSSLMRLWRQRRW
jgi:hypothetical protein